MRPFHDSFASDCFQLLPLLPAAGQAPQYLTNLSWPLRPRSWHDSMHSRHLALLAIGQVGHCALAPGMAPCTPGTWHC